VAQRMALEKMTSPEQFRGIEKTLVGAIGSQGVGDPPRMRNWIEK
jgi:hypothetical protein